MLNRSISVHSHQASKGDLKSNSIKYEFIGSIVIHACVLFLLSVCGVRLHGDMYVFEPENNIVLLRKYTFYNCVKNNTFLIEASYVFNFNLHAFLPALVYWASQRVRSEYRVTLMTSYSL